MNFPQTREGALERLEQFLDIVPDYSRKRNFVMPGHMAVSQLSAAIRHRLITEREVAARVMEAHPPPVAEKFVQEIYWRLYWKSWLSLRPHVWAEFSADSSDAPRASDVENARSGNPVIDHFARELAGTGYLHNHARMWVAGWWVHEARLPWQAGARWFFRHLLDADPASNTLSWRWVAGLQTPGKTYLTRRSNLETYLDPNLLEPLKDGLGEFENPRPHLPGTMAREPVTRPELAVMAPDPSLKSGLWIHEEDLSPETLPWPDLHFAALRVFGHAGVWRGHHAAPLRQTWLQHALADAANRASKRWNLPCPVETPGSLGEAVGKWAASEGLEQIVLMRPAVGPLGDEFELSKEIWLNAGLRVAVVDRPEDQELRPFATSGFFGFWEKVRKKGANPADRIRA